MEADAPPLRGREREGGGAGADSPTPDREPESLIWKRKAGGTPTSEGERERGEVINSVASLTNCGYVALQ